MKGACFISTKAKLGTCHKCQRTVWTALDEGVRVRVDRVPLAEVGAELRAVLAGKRTYTKTLVGEIVERTAGRIREGSPRGPVHVEHYCQRASSR
jgi:hypothetical protein